VSFLAIGLKNKASTGRGGVPNRDGGVFFIAKRELFREKKKTVSLRSEE
jgi:hypothetical protein